MTSPLPSSPRLKSIALTLLLLAVNPFGVATEPALHQLFSSATALCDLLPSPKFFPELAAGTIKCIFLAIMNIAGRSLIAFARRSLTTQLPVQESTTKN